MHHIRKLADLDKFLDRSGPTDMPVWAAIMAKRRRKALVVCQYCHDNIHARTTASRKTHGVVTGEPDDRKRSRPVRWGGHAEKDL